MTIVQALAGILFEMNALDANHAGAAVIQVHGHAALSDDWRLVLADLIALRQIRIEVILSVKNGYQIDLCVEAEAGTDGLSDALLINNREHAGHRRINKRHVRVGRAAKFRR